MGVRQDRTTPAGQIWGVVTSATPAALTPMLVEGDRQCQNIIGAKAAEACRPTLYRPRQTISNRLCRFVDRVLYKNVVSNVPCDCRVCPAQRGIVMCGRPCHCN